MELKQKLKTFLADGDEMYLIMAERELSFTKIFETEAMPFCKVVNEKKLLESIVKLTHVFLKNNFADCENEAIALQFAFDITDVRKDWNLLDIVNFFKFIRQRQDITENKIFGSKINTIKLMELAAIYEDHKAMARETWHKENINKTVFGTTEQRLMISSGDMPKDTRFAELAKMLIDKENIEKDKMYANAATTTKFLKDLEQHWNAQMELVERGEKTELEAIEEHSNYRLNYDFKL